MVADAHPVIPEADDEFDVWDLFLDAFEDIWMCLAHHLQGFDASLTNEPIVHLFEELVIAAVKAYPASSSGHLLPLLL
jgi:hypothetical protein